MIHDASTDDWERRQVPVARLELGRRAGRLSATLQVAAPVLNLAVALTSVLLAGFMVLYWVAENL